MNRFIIAISLSLHTLIVWSGETTLYNPLRYDDPSRLSSMNGYCSSYEMESKLWGKVNKFASSFIAITAGLPPEQLKYIKEELNSKNNERVFQIASNPFYIMSEIYDEMSTIKELSSLYIKHHKRLPLEKKVEITGRILLNITSEKINYNRIDWLSSELNRKGYIISPNRLRELAGVRNGIRRLMLEHLICYGENYKW